MFVCGLASGLIIGGVIGVIIMCLCCAASEADKQYDTINREATRWRDVKIEPPIETDDCEYMLITDGDEYATGFWRNDAKAFDNTNTGWPQFDPTHWKPFTKLSQGGVSHDNNAWQISEKHTY